MTVIIFVDRLTTLLAPLAAKSRCIAKLLHVGDNASEGEIREGALRRGEGMPRLVKEVPLRGTQSLGVLAKQLGMEASQFLLLRDQRVRHRSGRSNRGAIMHVGRVTAKLSPDGAGNSIGAYTNTISTTHKVGNTITGHSERITIVNTSIFMM